MTNGLIVTGIYILICIVSVFFVRQQSIRYARRNNRFDVVRPGTKISHTTMIFVSVSFTLLNVFSTGISPEYGSDRFNYAYEFTGARSTYSVALDLIFDLIKKFGGDIETAFYLTTFLCVFLTLVAYKISSRTNYKVFMLMLTSEWILFTFTALKQAYACAFACLFFIFVIEDRSKRGTVLSIVCALIASMFHISGLILFPIMFLIRMKTVSKKWANFWCVVIVGSILALKPMMIFLANIIEGFLPIYATKIYNYFVLGNHNERASLFAFIKYLPFYYIAILGVIKRRKYASIIEDYNKYMIISVLSACLVAYSVVSYWFSRFTGIFILPVFIFFNLINNRLSDKTNRLVGNVIVYGAGFVVLIRKIILIFVNYGFF